MPSPTDFNLTPYYDDYTEGKKFHRILFRPSFAVQARELTQSQTILQNQIERLSDHIFEQGAMVIPGEISFDLNYYAVKLSSFGSNLTPADFVGVTMTSASGVVARVVNSTDSTTTDPDTLFVKYENSGTSGNATAFADGETITGTKNISGVDTVITATVSTTSTGCAAKIAAGVYYINGFHVSVSEQTLILDKYTNTPSYRVGLLVAESFVTQNEDGSLNDNAQGVSNTNAPGAHRFKIDLTLTKLGLGSADDENFIELLRLKNGILQNQVRTTEYAVLEDTLARRTFDESGDYAVKDFDLDLREHLIDGDNRGIYTEADGGVETKLAAGLSPGKAYVRGYEIETIGTTFVDINKARDFDTENANQTRFDVGNYVYVNNVYNAPEFGFPVTGETTAFQQVKLFSVEDMTIGTGGITRDAQITNAGTFVRQIGRAKTRGFEFVSGSASGGALSSSTTTDSIFKHYLFDMEMFTHLNITTAQSFTTGEVITGSSSGATGVVDTNGTNSRTDSLSVSSISVASPGVVTTSTDHNFREGQRVTISSTSGWAIDSVSQDSSAQVFTVRNPDYSADTFELYELDGITPVNVTAYGSGGTVEHGVVTLYNVKGTFIAGETITGGTSSNTAIIQNDAVGFRGVRTHDFGAVKKITMAATGSAGIYTSNPVLDSTYGSNFNLTGTMSVSNGETTVTGFGTSFSTELKIGDEIQFTTNAGDTLTRIVEAIVSNTQLELFTAVGGADVTTKSNIVRRRAKLQEPNKNVSIFKLPYENIKSLTTESNLGVSDTLIKFRRIIVQTLNSDGQATGTAGTNESFDAFSSEDYLVSIMDANVGATSGSEGDILSLTGNNHEGDPIFTRAAGGGSITLDFGANYDGHKIKIIATLTRTEAQSKTKTFTTLTSGLTKNNQSVIESGVISLKDDVTNIAYADVISLENVYMSSNFSTAATINDLDISDRFDLDTGQRDNYYDVGRLILKTGAIVPTGQLLIVFSYYTHSGSGTHFDVDSYPQSGGTQTYENIPSYTSDTTGERFELRDCLDFRPRVDSSSDIDTGDNDRSFGGVGGAVFEVPKFGSDISSDFEYYLPRVDKIFLDKEGNFKVVEGASSIIPQSPKNLDGAMHLYTLNVPAYTLSPEDIEIEKVDNRRYTMRDIGKLESRIENLEYYTQLSLLETQAQNLQIQDADGLDRFKNGFIVDNFTGHGIGDVSNLDYNIAMDMAAGEMRPTHSEDAVQLIETDEDGTAIVAGDRVTANYAKTGDLITLPYTEETLINQPFASKTLNVNPFDVITWVGNIDLTPPTDEWKETNRAPELVINQQGGFDTLVSGLGNSALQSVEIGTVWNDWQDFWTGRPFSSTTRDISGNLRSGRRVFRRTETTTAREVRQTRTGVRQILVPQVVRNSIGDRIVNVAFVPFIRSRTITFNGTRMKPNTKVFAFFDNIDVSSYITPEGGTLGGALTTDNNGAVSGTFTIPDPTNNSNPRWRTGERVFRLTSSSTDSRLSDVETSAEADYVARGILETVQETIISTREPRLVRTNTTETRSINRTSTRTSTRTIGWVDPLAQTFLIDDEGGVFITSVDLFFSTKDDNIPITLQIREVVNGYPGSKVIPFSEVTLNPSSVNVSSDATTATKFTFSSPVYLQENTEYCFVVLANSNSYNTWVARMGETTIDGNRTISQQPYAGVLFKSQNGSTWTADQNEDIKFLMRRAEFSVTNTGTVSFCNDTLPTRRLQSNPLRTVSGSNVVRVFHPNHGMHGTSNQVTISGVPTGSNVNGIPPAELNTTHTSISNITFDSYDITVSSNATDDGDAGGSDVEATQNRVYDILNLNMQTMTVPGTSISSNIRTTTGKSLHGTESEFSLDSATNTTTVILNDNIYFESPRMVASGINETAQTGFGTTDKSLFVNCTLSSTNSKLSPVIDIQRVSAITVSNRLNNPSASNVLDQSGASAFVADTASTGTSTDAVYITRPVTLENASTALDIRLSANVRATSNLKVYYRVTSSEEVRNIDNLTWTPFNGDGSEDTTVTPAEDDNTFKEYKFSASNLNDFTSFQLKITMTGTNSAYPPIVSDLRGIALAV